MDMIDKILDAIGGLEGACKVFGWQGGTIHQAKTELMRRLAQKGIQEYTVYGKCFRLELAEGYRIEP